MVYCTLENTCRWCTVHCGLYAVHCTRYAPQWNLHYHYMQVVRAAGGGRYHLLHLPGPLLPQGETLTPPSTSLHPPSLHSQSSTCSRQCLNVNLGPGYIKLATASLGSWSCLLCHSAPLSQPRSRLRAPAPPPSMLMAGRSPGGARPPAGHRPQVGRGRAGTAVICWQVVRAVRPTTPRMVRPR